MGNWGFYLFLLLVLKVVVEVAVVVSLNYKAIFS